VEKGLVNKFPTGLKAQEGRRILSRLVQFHEDPKIIAGWVGLTGPLLHWLTPPRRRSLLALGAIGLALKVLVDPLKEVGQSHAWMEALTDIIPQLLVVFILLGFLWLSYRLALRFSSLPSFVRRNPQICLHAVFWMLLIVIWSISPEVGIWRMVLVGLAIMLPFFLWRLGYLLFAGQRGKVAGTRFRDHLMYLWPVYGGSNTPYGKGHEYLSRHEAKDEEALARAQLAGIRLLILAGLWFVSKEVMNGLVFGVDNSVRLALGGFTLGVPRLGPLVEKPEMASVGLAWVALYCELFINVLHRAVKGHVIIGVLRLFGFYIFRNTYKPLLAETVVGFWNRYYYYFKEILVDFFFYPTFARWFRKKPVIRLFAAVFMAAFIGNMYYHLIRMADTLAAGDLEAIWLSLHSRLFYCLLLSLGIFISMWREQRRTRQSRARGIVRRGLSIFGVWTFFAVIHIWNQKGPTTFFSLTHFFLGLIGLG
jgi:hypothetical protein